MFKARGEQLKDLKKLIRIIKKLIPIVKERNYLERNFLFGLESYFEIKDEINLLEKTTMKSTDVIKVRNEYIEFLKETIKKFEEKNRTDSEKRKAKKKVEKLEKQIEEYVKYINSRAHNFIGFGLTQEEYTFCECDDLSIFIISLILKEEFKGDRNTEFDERIILDNTSSVGFRRRIFLYENDVRTVLTKKISNMLNRKLSDAVWEKEDDLLEYPLFTYFDFKSFIKLL